MPDNVINLEEYRKEKSSENCWAAIMASDPEKLKKLITDILGSEQTIEEKIHESTISITQKLIHELYEIQANPEDKKLADDMAIITMLYTASIEEFFTKANKNKAGNEVYQMLIDMKEKVIK